MSELRLDQVNWPKLEGMVVERIRALAAIVLKSDAPDDMQAAINRGLILPNLHLLLSFIESVTIEDAEDVLQ